MKRLFDVTFAILLLLVMWFPLILVAIAVRLTSAGPVIYWSQRVGRNGEVFWMPKFRSMKVKTPEVASDRLENPQQWLTPIGSFLRRTSLDEFPQLLSVLQGHMSFVGPRPCLTNQKELIAMRQAAGVDKLLPGLTGWAQINGRDAVHDEEKVAYDTYYLQHQSMWFDLKIVGITIVKVIRMQDIDH